MLSNLFKNIKMEIEEFWNKRCQLAEYFDIYDAFGIPNRFFIQSNISGDNVSMLIRNSLFVNEKGEHESTFRRMLSFENKDRFNLNYKGLCEKTYYCCAISSIYFDDKTKNVLTVNMKYLI
jgi:hypothetical protein